MPFHRRIFFAFLVAASFGPAHAATAPAATTEIIVYTKTGEVPLKLELATTPETRLQGLMKRDSLKPLDGMLFVFPKPHDYAFWMKDTHIPLDMLFIRDNRTIAHIEANVTPYTLAARSAGEEICAVIELDGGQAERQGIAVGDHVRYALPESVEVR